MLLELITVTDRHAVLETAEFHNSLDRLDRIDRPRLQARDFKRDPDDPGKFQRYQVEALVYPRFCGDTGEGVRKSRGSSYSHFVPRSFFFTANANSIHSKRLA